MVCFKGGRKGKIKSKGCEVHFRLNLRMNFSHGLRIIWQVKQILKTGKLIVHFEEGSKIRNKVLAIKMGGYKGDEPQLHEIAQKLRSKIRPLEEKAKQSSLPPNFLPENVNWINGNLNCRSNVLRVDFKVAVEICYINNLHLCF